MAGTPYKILGKIADAAGVGILGHNTASSGETRGVEGRVDSPDGHGLYTDDDAYVGGELRTNELNGVRYAETADEIQPAIDDLAGKVADGTIRSGVVKLYPKAYYPETTIWLKKGVVLEGYRQKPLATGGVSDVANNVLGTTLYSSALPEGDAYDPYPTRDGSDSAATYRHFNSETAHDAYRSDPNRSDAWFRDNTHPHLPVVAAYNQMPIYGAQTVSEETAELWGDGVGLKNLRIVADQRRYWDPADASDSPVGSESSTPREHATYFGVYDGFIFEDLSKLLVENVHVGGFAGYNGFYQDIRNVISRGNTYGRVIGPDSNASGTATDHHGASFLISHSNGGRNNYMRGQWSVKVRGPTPTLVVDNHASESQFVRGGWVKNSIKGRDCQFLTEVETRDGTYDESVYDAGDAPIVDNSYKHVVAPHRDAKVRWSGYTIVDNAIRADKKGIVYERSNARFEDMKIGTDGNCLELNGTDVYVSDSRLITGENAYCVSMENQGLEGLNDCVLEGGTDSAAIYFDNRSKLGRLMAYKGEIRTDYVVSANYPGGASGIMTFSGCGFRTISDLSDDPNTDFKGSIAIADPARRYLNQAAASDTQSGDGITTSYTIAHGLDEDPGNDGWYHVEPTTAAANGEFYVTADGTHLTLNYDTAPPDGTDNLGWTWMAKGWSAPEVAVSL